MYLVIMVMKDTLRCIAGKPAWLAEPSRCWISYFEMRIIGFQVFTLGIYR